MEKAGMYKLKLDFITQGLDFCIKGSYNSDRILQKGSVENMNKIFREYYPKGTDFRWIEQREMDKVQYQIDERSKKLAFSTPKRSFSI